MNARYCALLIGLLCAIATPAIAFEFRDGTVQIHGAAELQLRTIVNESRHW